MCSFPEVICSTSSSSGRQHEILRSAIIGRQADGGWNSSIGLKLSNDHLLPTIPAMHTIPRCFAQQRESRRVVVPTSSRTLLTPPGYTSPSAGDEDQVEDSPCEGLSG